LCTCKREKKIVAEVSIAPGFRNEQAILKQVEKFLNETYLDGKLCKVHIKHPPVEANIDMNYLLPGGLLELEVVDSLENLEGRLRH